MHPPFLIRAFRLGCSKLTGSTSAPNQVMPISGPSRERLQRGIESVCGIKAKCPDFKVLPEFNGFLAGNDISFGGRDMLLGRRLEPFGDLPR